MQGLNAEFIFVSPVIHVKYDFMELLIERLHPSVLNFALGELSLCQNIGMTFPDLKTFINTPNKYKTYKYTKIHCINYINKGINHVFQ